jgi:hypothetical protein
VAARDGHANGGTGKSLLFEALKQLVPVVTIDGRGFDPRGTKELQEVKDSTRILVFDDWNTQLSFERLFVFATGPLVVDRLYSGKQSYAFAVSSKIGLTTNGMLTGQGGSHDRRRYEVEVSAHYGPTGSRGTSSGTTSLRLLGRRPSGRALTP